MGRITKMIWPWLLLVLVAGTPLLRAQDAPKPFSKEELEQLVAPIALYPDSLVAQILMASTYPLEIVEAARWSKANPNLKEKALEDALQKQKWDPSVKSLTAFPTVLAGMNEKLEVTQKMGDAFLGQQKEVLAAIQTLRARADKAGNLKSSKEQTVTKAQEGGQTVIKVEPANPEVVYVPSYNPAVVYGPWPYPSYPPYYYYPYPPGAALFTFGVGLAIGGALWGNCNWGGGDVNINMNKYNNFNRTDIKNSNWQHNAEHRKGVGYRDQASQQKFGKGADRAGAASREQFRGRAEQGRQEISRGAADGLKGDRAPVARTPGAIGQATAAAIAVRGWPTAAPGRATGAAAPAIVAVAVDWATAGVVVDSAMAAGAEGASMVSAVGVAARATSAAAARRVVAAAEASVAAAGRAVAAGAAVADSQGEDHALHAIEFHPCRAARPCRGAGPGLLARLRRGGGQEAGRAEDLWLS